MFKFVLAAVLALPLASFACDYNKLVAVTGGYNSVKVLRTSAGHCDADTVALADDYADNVQVLKVRRVRVFGSDYAYHDNVNVIRVENHRNVKVVRVKGGNDGGSGLVGAVRVAKNTVKRLFGAVIGN